LSVGTLIEFYFKLIICITITEEPEAVGQFVVYTHLLRRYYPEYKLFLAVSENTCKTVFEEEAGQTLIEDGIIQLFSFDPNQEVIVRWLP